MSEMSVEEYRKLLGLPEPGGVVEMSAEEYRGFVATGQLPIPTTGPATKRSTKAEAKAKKEPCPVCGHARCTCLEDRFLAQIEAEGLPVPRREFEFSERKFRFDFCWPDRKIAVEIEGFGRHQRKAGYETDCVKYNLAAVRGYALYRFTGKMVKDGRALKLMREVLRG